MFNGTQSNLVGDDYSDINMTPLKDGLAIAAGSIAGLGLLAAAAYVLRHKIGKCCNVFNTSTVVQGQELQRMGARAPLMGQGENAAEEAVAGSAASYAAPQ